MQKQPNISIHKNADLSNANTFGIKAKAREFVQFNSEDAIVEYVTNHPIKDSRFMVLGGGSNILLTGDFDGIMLSANLTETTLLKEDDDYVWLKSGAGVVWHDLVNYCLSHNYGGIENLSLIPGKNGAAPIQNIGAYGVELKDVFVELNAVDLFDGTRHTFTHSDCEFGYRDSIFKRGLKHRMMITSITLRLRKKPEFNLEYGAIRQTLEEMGVQDITIQAVSKAVCSIRQSKLPDPKEIGNSGSFFKNPIVSNSVLEKIQQEHADVVFFPVSKKEVKIPAGWLIERAGWKGKRFGETGVHEKQALVLVNYGNANGQEVFELSEKILADIHSKFGIKLEREVNVV